MIRVLLISSLFAGATALMGAPSDVGLLPQDKESVVVETSELNPFGIRTKQAPGEAVIVVESEETRVRAAIDRLSVGGLTRSYGVTKVLLGSHMVMAGETLPEVIPRQTEKVKVVAVNDHEIELGFVEKDGNVGERKILLGVDLKPVVRYRIHGNPPAASEEAALDGVYKDHEARLPKD